MDLRWLNLVFIALVALTACGSEPEQVSMDRRFLAGEYLDAEKEKIQAGIEGVVLDQYEWVFGELKVYTVLSREQEAGTDYTGIFLRQYDLSGQTASLLWTYQDSVLCADAGAVLVNHTQGLTPVQMLGDGPEQFVLAYDLGCSSDEVPHRNVIVIDAQSGTPAVRIAGTDGTVNEAVGLHDLPGPTRSKLLSLLWAKSEIEE